MYEIEKLIRGTWTPVYASGDENDALAAGRVSASANPRSSFRMRHGEAVMAYWRAGDGVAPKTGPGAL